jgi:serine protease Do
MTSRTLRFLLTIACLASTAALVSAEDAPRDDFSLPRAQQLAFREAVRAVRPYVVRIDTIGGAQPSDSLTAGAGEVEVDADGDGLPDEPEPNPFRDTLGSGFTVADGPTTGILYHSDGYILTSSFNFVRDPSHITVRLDDGRQYVAHLIARDKVRKLALLKVDATDLPTAPWAPSDDIRIGQWAIALGRGFGGDDPSVTVGVISAKGRMMGNAIQTDAKLSPANYGGPVVDLDGRVLGIAVPMAQRPGELAGVEFYDAGIGFAVPRERVEDIVADLKKGVSFHRGWLGVSTRQDPDAKKLIIRAVADPSPVQAAGIQPGDAIVYANGNEVKGIQHLVQSIYMAPAGETVFLVTERDGLQYGFEIVLARSEELGPLAEPEIPPADPDDPFPIPDDSPWP